MARNRRPIAGAPAAACFFFGAAGQAAGELAAPGGLLKVDRAAAGLDPRADRDPRRDELPAVEQHDAAVRAADEQPPPATGTSCETCAVDSPALSCPVSGGLPPPRR